MAIMDGTYVDKDTFVGTEASHMVSLTIGNVGGGSLGVGSGSSYSTTVGWTQLRHMPLWLLEHYHQWL